MGAIDIGLLASVTISRLRQIVDGITITVTDDGHLQATGSAVTTFAAPVTLSAGESNATGTSTSAAHADHLHATPVGLPVRIVVDASPSTGSSGKFADASHQHGITLPPGAYSSSALDCLEQTITYAEPLYISLSSEPQAIVLVRARATGDPDTGFAYGAEVPFKWDAVHSRAQVDSIDGLLIGTEYDLVFALISGTPITVGSITPGTPLGLCDKISALCHGAYSLYRKQRQDYTGPALVVRRDSDSVRLTVGFLSSGLVDWASVVSFCTGANGYLCTVFDHSIFGCHLNKNTLAAQPKVYDSSTGKVLLNALSAFALDGSSNDFGLLGGSVGNFKLGGEYNTAVTPDLAIAWAGDIEGDWTTNTRGGIDNIALLSFVGSVSGLWVGRDNGVVPSGDRPALVLSKVSSSGSFVYWKAASMPGGVLSGVKYFLLERPGNGARLDASTLRCNGGDLGAPHNASGQSLTLTNTTTLGNKTFTFGSDNGALFATGKFSCFFVIEGLLSSADRTVIETELAAHVA